MARTFNGRKLYITEATRDAFWDATPAGTISADPAGKQILWWVCITCRRWNTFDALQIGHVVEWAKHLADNGVTMDSTYEDAQAWFNDMSNLAPQCKSCNTGHEWEYRNYLGESDDEEDADASGNLAGFVTYPCPACGSEDTKDSDTMSDDASQFAYECETCGHEWTVTSS